jgi:hypothetical protein
MSKKIKNKIKNKNKNKNKYLLNPLFNYSYSRFQKERTI